MAGVLVVEDNRLIARMLDTLMRAAGIDVSIAYGGEVAWTSLGSADPPLVAVIDWELPDTTGIELCRKVRARSADAPFIYLVLTTGRFTQREIAEGVASEADEHIAKPFRVDHVIARVQHGLRLAAERRAKPTGS